MHARAVVAAARIGVSVEPFASYTLPTWRGRDEVLHFDYTCSGSATLLEREQSVELSMGDLYRFRLCPLCQKTYSVPHDLERYAVAIEHLQRGRLLCSDLDVEGAGSVESLKTRWRIERECRAALSECRHVSSLARREIERMVQRVRQSVEHMNATEGDVAIRANYLAWAASLRIEADMVASDLYARDPRQWRRTIEHARGLLRSRGWDAFREACTDRVGATFYQAAVEASLTESGHVLCVLGSGDDEGDFVAYIAATSFYHRDALTYSIVPNWAVDVVSLLNGSLVVIGAIEPEEVDVMSTYAELARTRSGGDVLLGARRLTRARRGVV